MKNHLLSVFFFFVVLLPAYNPSVWALAFQQQDQSDKKTIEMRVVVPKFFVQTDLTNKMIVKVDQKNGQICENRGSLTGNSLMYSFQCPDETKFRLLLEGFYPMSVIYSPGAEVALGESDMNAVFSIPYPYRQIFQYWHNNRKINQQDSFALSLKDMAGGVQLIAKTIGSQIDVTDCSIAKPLTPEDLLHKQALELRPTCELQTVTWPAQWGKPERIPEQCQYSESILTCLKNTPGDLSWGGAWLPVKWPHLSKEKKTLALRASHFIPDWPLTEKDPLLMSTTPHWEPCKARPSYKPVSIQYCSAKHTTKTTCKEINISAIQKNFIMPSLQEIGWDVNTPLPQSALITLKKTSNNPKYKDMLTLSWPLGKSLDVPKKALVDLVDDMYEILPLATLFENQEVAYDHGSRLLIFENRQGCIDTVKRNLLAERVFLPGEIQNIKLPACTWAKVVKGSEDKSFCERGERKEGKIEFQLLPNVFKGKRKVIVVANSLLLAGEGRGIAIQGALIDWFINLKKSQKPVNLFTVEGDGQIRQILRGEDLRGLKPSSNAKNPPPTIAGRINNSITFHADGFRTLKDLEFVERELHVLDIGEVDKVLYFTDDTMPRTIFNYDLGTPLGWKKEGIGLTVVTNGKCKEWIDRAEADCVTLQKSPNKSDIKKILKEFL